MCMYEGRILYEFVRVLGFAPQQSAPDRDKYVRINFENIAPHGKYAFEKYSDKEFDTKSGYDYESIMQFRRDFFSKNGKDTITAKNGAKIGNMDQLSDMDVANINTLYNCYDSTNDEEYYANYYKNYYKNHK